MLRIEKVNNKKGQYIVKCEASFPINEIKYEVCNNFGKIIASGSSNNNVFTIDLSNFNFGIYQLNAFCKDQMCTININHT